MDVHKADIIKYKRAVLNILINARATLIDRIRHCEASSAIAQISAAVHSSAKGSTTEAPPSAAAHQPSSPTAASTSQVQQQLSSGQSSLYTATHGASGSKRAEVEGVATPGSSSSSGSGSSETNGDSSSSHVISIEVQTPIKSEAGIATAVAASGVESIVSAVVDAPSHPSSSSEYNSMKSTVSSGDTAILAAFNSNNSTSKKHVAFHKTREMLLSQAAPADSGMPPGQSPALLRTSSLSSNRSWANPTNSNNFATSSSGTGGASLSRKNAGRLSANQASSLEAQQLSSQESTGFNAQYYRYTSTNDGCKYGNISPGAVTILREKSLSGKEADGLYFNGEITVSSNTNLHPPLLLPRIKGHWDYLMDEMQWMAVDFRQEVRWKLLYSKAVAELCSEHLRRKRKRAGSSSVGVGMDIDGYVSDDSTTQQKRLVAHKLAKDVSTFWKISREIIGNDIRKAFVGSVALAADEDLVSPFDCLFDSPFPAPAVADPDELQQSRIEEALSSWLARVDALLVLLRGQSTALADLHQKICGLASHSCGACLYGEVFGAGLRLAAGAVDGWSRGSGATVFLPLKSAAKWAAELRSRCPRLQVQVWDENLPSPPAKGAIYLVAFEVMADYLEASLQASPAAASSDGDAMDIVVSSVGDENRRTGPVNVGSVIVDTVGVFPEHAQAIGAYLQSSRFSSGALWTSSSILTFIATHFVTNETNRILVRARAPTAACDDCSGVLSFLLPQLAVPYLSGWIDGNKAQVDAVFGRLSLDTSLDDVADARVTNHIAVCTEEVEMEAGQRLKYDYLMHKFKSSGVLSSPDVKTVYRALSILKSVTFHENSILVDVDNVDTASVRDERLPSDAMDDDESASSNNASKVFVVCSSGNKSPRADSCKLACLRQLLLSSASKATNVLVLVETAVEVKIVEDLVKRVVTRESSHVSVSFAFLCDYQNTAELKSANKIVCVASMADYESYFSPTILGDAHQFGLVVDVSTCWLSAPADMQAIKRSISPNAKIIQIVASDSLDERSGDVLKSIGCSADSVDSTLRSLLSCKESGDCNGAGASLVYSNQESLSTISTAVAAPACAGGDMCFTSGRVGIAMARLRSVAKSRRKSLLTHVAKAAFIEAKADASLRKVESQFFKSDPVVAKKYFDSQTITTRQRRELRSQGIGASSPEALLNMLLTPAVDTSPRSEETSAAPALAGAGGSYGTFAPPADAPWVGHHVPAPPTSAHLASRMAAQKHAGDAASAGPFSAVALQFSHAMTACSKAGLPMDATLYVHPLQTSLYSEVSFLPAGRQLASEELSVSFASAKRQRSAGAEDGDDAHGAAYSRRHVLETSSHPMDVVKLRLGGGSKAPRGGATPYTAIAAPMPAAGGSRWPADAELATEPWTQEEDNIIVAIQVLYRDSSFAVSEHVLAMTPRRFGRIRSAKQIKDRCTFLLNKGMVNLSDPAIIQLIETFKAGSSKIEPAVAAGFSPSSAIGTDATAAADTAASSGHTVLATRSLLLPDFAELSRVSGIIVSISDNEPAARPALPEASGADTADGAVAGPTLQPAVMSAFQLATMDDLNRD